jgi:hypothetical protein
MNTIDFYKNKTAEIYGEISTTEKEASRGIFLVLFIILLIFTIYKL